MSDRIQRPVMFDPRAFEVVKDTAQAKGLGGKGFSAAVNLIVLEWLELKRQVTSPTPQENQK